MNMFLMFQLEMRFARALKEKKGFVIKPIQEDGACLFRAVCMYMSTMLIPFFILLLLL